MNTTHAQRIKALSKPMAPIATDLTAQAGDLTDIQVMLFDVYGTLFISGSGDIGILKERQSGHALSEAMHEAGLSGDIEQAGLKGSQLLPEYIQQVHRELKGEGVAYPEVEIREIWQTICQQLLHEKLLNNMPSPETIEQLAIEYECRVNPVWPMPHLEELLTTCHRRNIHIGIISNAQFFTPLLFEALTAKTVQKWGFEAPLCIWSYLHREAKPSTQLFQQALEKLNTKPEHILYIGNDIRNDIHPAMQCGIKTALFAGDQRSLRLRKDDPTLATIQPDIILTDLNQLQII